jgi:hypothetical protein
MFKSTLFKGIVLTFLVFLSMIGIHYIIQPKGEWTPIFYTLPIILGYLGWLIWKTR